MAFVYDPTTDIGKVRLLANDRNAALLAAETTFASDADITAMLELEAGNIKRAAAQLIDTIADDEAMVQKYIKTNALETDGSKTAKVLHERAGALRAQADKEEAQNGDEHDAEMFDIVSLTC